MNRDPLGAGRRDRLFRQSLVESLFLAGLGGLMGLAVAGTACACSQRLGGDAFPRLDEWVKPAPGIRR